MNKKINPYCKKYPGAFIEFTGLVTPCCWLVTDVHRYTALEKFMAEDFKRIFITNSKEDIQAAYEKLEQSWDSDTPFSVCQLVCGIDNNPNHPLDMEFIKDDPEKE